MRQSQFFMIMVLLTAGLLGVYWFARGQESRPWPPPPVKLDDDVRRPASSLVTPPVPPSGTMPPAPVDPLVPPNPKAASKAVPKTPPQKLQSKGGAPETINTTTRKWTVCGIGNDDEPQIQQVGHQEPAPPPTPPMVTMPTNPPTTPAPMATPPPLVPDAPKMNPMQLVAPNGPSPNGPSPHGPSPQGPAPNAGTMPSADAPRSDGSEPRKSVITDPVKQAPALGSPTKNTTPGAPALASPTATKPPAKAAAFVHFNKSGKAPQPVPAVTVAPGGAPASVAPAKERAQMADSGPTMVLGVQSPPVTVEKKAMSVRAGEPQAFQLIVRNQGTVLAPQVSVEDDLPADARVLQAEPAPRLQNGRAIWTVTDLPAGGVRVFNLVIQSAVPVDTHSTRVHVIAASNSHTSASPALPSPASTGPAPAPPTPGCVAVQVKAPAGVVAGQPAILEVTYANTGGQRLTGLVLHAVLSEGLHHPIGRNIEADVGELEPGTSKTVKVTVAAVQPGRQGVQVQVKSASGPAASAQAGLDVVAAQSGLVVRQAPAVRLFMGRTADLRIDVTNHSPKQIRHVMIVSYLPEGLEFVDASDYGNFQPNGRTINWLLDPLPPGATQAVYLRVRPTVTAQLQHVASARADGVPESRSMSSLAVEGIADLAVSLNGDNAIEVGRETVYEVRVGNPGTGANTKVHVEFAFTPGLVPRNAKGPVPFRIDGQRVIFEDLSSLVSQGQAVYQVLAVGQAPADARVRASVTSDQVRSPAVREKATRVYRD